MKRTRRYLKAYSHKTVAAPRRTAAYLETLLLERNRKIAELESRLEHSQRN